MPWPKDHNKPKRISVHVGTEMRARVDNLAWKERENLTRFVMRALDRECKRLEKKHAKADK